MRLRAKFFCIYALIFCSVISVVLFSLLTVRRLERIRDTMDSGAALLEHSRRVRTLTKEIMIGAFAPGAYADLKDVVYFEPYAAALRDWKDSVATFRSRFSVFMNDEPLKTLVRGGVMRDEYETAWIMSRKAFASLDSLIAQVDTLRDRDLLGSADLYAIIQGSSDPALIGLFAEARQTSYYLANSFESYLNYFIESLQRESSRARGDMIAYFIAIGFVTAAFATAVTLLFSSRIVRRLKTVGEAIRRVSMGDFTTPLAFDTADEFRQLSDDFNRYTNALKDNVAAMVSLTRDVAASVWEMEKGGAARSGDVSITDRVLGAVVEAAVRDSRSIGGVLVELGPSGVSIRVERGEAGFASDPERGFPEELAALPDDAAVQAFPPDVLAGPLSVPGRRFGVLALFNPERTFNDLDLIRFANFLEFAVLIADNAAQYSQLTELRSAEYQALQSQVRPHFLFNVLSGFAALNRYGETEKLERSILALKDLLRYTVDHGAHASVAEEFAFCRRYCELQGMRFGDRLSWRVEADEETLGFRLPKLLLQPLVENAVIHGIEPSGEKGSVVVTARRAAGADGTALIRLSVTDDGVGFDTGNIPRGVGIGNVERRLALAYPRARMTVGSAPGRGCVIDIDIPSEDECAS